MATNSGLNKKEKEIIKNLIICARNYFFNIHQTNKYELNELGNSLVLGDFLDEMYSNNKNKRNKLKKLVKFNEIPECFTLEKYYTKNEVSNAIKKAHSLGLILFSKNNTSNPSAGAGTGFEGGYKKRVGSRAQVMHGTARQTGGGLKKNDLKYNKHGRIVSKKLSALGKKNIKFLERAGYKAKKGKFGI
jgi:hypothetical protein